jgi:lantibiotic modifying enzyme
VWLGDEQVLHDGRWVVAYRSVGGDLYGGTAGIGLVLSQVAAATGEPEVANAARGALRHAVSWVERTRPPGSLFSGSAGVACALVDAAESLDDPSLTDAALDLALAAAEAPPTSNDVISGRAGSVLALLHLGREMDRPEVTAAAETLGERLVDAAEPVPAAGLAWPSDGEPGESPLCGLAHGASGPVLALTELASVRGSERLLDVAVAGTAYERAWYSAEHQNWPDLRELDREAMTRGEAPGWPAYWCHGSLGIGLARLRLLELTGRPVFEAEATVALDSAVSQVRAAAALDAETVGEQGDFSLCHGLGAAIDLLLEGARVLRRPALYRVARRAGDLVVELTESAAGPWPSGVHRGGENPSLMLGLAGTALMFLRLANPQVVSPLRAYAVSVVTRRVIVQLRAPVDPATLAGQAERLCALAPGTEVERISPRGRVLLRLPVDADLESALDALGAADDVEYAEADVIDTAQGPEGTSPDLDS